MSDPEVPQPKQPADVNDVVDSAKAGLADAEVARGERPVSETADVDAAADDRLAAEKVDPDLAAFEEAEKSHPGTFVTPELAEESEFLDRPAEDSQPGPFAATRSEYAAHSEHAAADASIADTAYLPPVADDAETRVVPSEPVAETVFATPLSQQPIFVQAPEPPRDRGNRGTAAGIGLLATLSFAILYLGAALGFGALVGDVTGENIGEAALAPLTTWGFWLPIAVFFIGFWLLGAIINRGRWGYWVVFGIVVGLFAYAGHILGQLFEAPFWLISTREGGEIVTEQMLAPLAIAAFVFGRELTIWFGAWVARSGARKTELNAEAQREYERTLEAGPSLPR